MDVGELSRALEVCYNSLQVRIQIGGTFYDIARVMKLADVSDRDSDDLVILVAEI